MKAIHSRRSRIGQQINAAWGTMQIELLEERKLLSTLATLASFKGSDGIDPQGGLVADAAGNLYGTAQDGGAHGVGALFEITAGAHKLVNLLSFDRSDGAGPQGTLIIDAQGNLYGTTQFGGTHRQGSIFKYDTTSGTLTTLWSFDNSDANDPEGGLVADSDGNLYGTTAIGGINESGTLYKLDPNSDMLTTLASFNDADEPQIESGSNLTIDASGNLYGTSQTGGTDSMGAIFKYDATAQTLNIIATFDGFNGGMPSSQLLADSRGNLYGTTGGIGTETALGTIFKLDPNTDKLTTLASFNGTNGLGPEGGLLMDVAGNIYGTTDDSRGDGGSTIFKLDAITGTITTLAPSSEAGGPGLVGAEPRGALIADSSGNLYGTTGSGGAKGDGSVFELSHLGFARRAVFATAPDSQAATALSPKSFNLGSFSQIKGVAPFSVDVAWGDGSAGTHLADISPGTITPSPHTFKTAGIYSVSVTVTDAKGDSATGLFTVRAAGRLTALHNFVESTGDFPGGVVADAAGNLFGTAAYGGGSDGDGTVFELRKSDNKLIALASFDGDNGDKPASQLLIDSAGNLLGTTESGGADGDGTIFELPANSGKFVVLESFDGTDGTMPQNGVIEDSSGNLYGTTAAGADGYGTVFRFSLAGGKLTTLATFNGTDGDHAGPLVLDSAGNIYGATEYGGSLGDGILFEVKAANHKLVTLATFAGTNGINPLGNLVADAAGNLFGTTEYGGDLSIGNGDGAGTVYEFNITTQQLYTLAKFDNKTGEQPIGGIIADAAGNLYGTTFTGGTNDDGTVFAYNAAAGALDVLATFNNTNGASPEGQLAADSAGTLYGTALSGGDFSIDDGQGGGTIFKIQASGFVLK